MSNNRAIGLAPEEEKVKENESEVLQDSSEDEETEDGEEAEESDEDAESEEDKVEVAPAPKKRGGSRAGKAVKSNRLEGMEYGLGDIRLDRSVPMSGSASKYLNALLESPLTNSVIPPDFLNEESEHLFCIQSLRFFVPKGKIVRVPMLVAEEIRNSFAKRI